MTKEIRRHRRSSYGGPVKLTWEVAYGGTRYAQGKCIDVSAGGLRVESPAAIPAGTRIALRAERIELSGSATVRRVDRYGSRYILALELSHIAGKNTLAALSEPGGSNTIV